MRTSPGRVAIAFIFLASVTPALAATGPAEPAGCGPSPPSARAPDGSGSSQSAITSWTLSQLPAEWGLQSCIGWDPQRFSSYAGVAGKIHAAGIDEVLARLGAISAYKGMRYWSVTDRKVETLVTEAFAVADAASKNGRPDFAMAEMLTGQELYFMERDNRSSQPVLYRMTILERRADRLVVDIANASKVRLFLLTLFEPGDVRTALFVSRADDGTWNGYALSGFHPRSIAGLLDNRQSHANRLIALYGHVAGSDENELPWAR
jgi:hypothetical protein